LTVQPGVAGHHCLKASLLQRLGRLEEALQCVQHAIELHPHDRKLIEDLGRINAAAEPAVASNSELARGAKGMFRKSVAKSLRLAGLVLRFSHE
jgi:tetratricopeptide (TPR) repeat protein